MKFKQLLFVIMSIEQRMQSFLALRKQNNLYRNLKNTNDLIDFSSNDYLGISRSAYVRQKTELEYQKYQYSKSGSTGSRLLNGNSVLYEALEQDLANFHHAEAALIYNSGFDANVGLVSTVIQKDDYVFFDAFIHASLHQGIKLSNSKSVLYNHNDYVDLEQKLQLTPTNAQKFIITESIFSMEGDKADLLELVRLSKQYNALLIIDEAHATGLFGVNGSGLCNEFDIEKECFARIYTFGKAIGMHGAVIVGSHLLKSYLINFSKNFIYSTALDTHTLLSVKHSYCFLQLFLNQRIKLFKLISYFNSRVHALDLRNTIVGEGPIFGLVVPGSEECRKLALYLQNNGLDVRPIVYPTVERGKERLRIILHSYNTQNEIDILLSLIVEYH